MVLFNVKKHKFLRRFEFIGNVLLKIVPFIKHDIAILDPEIKANIFLTELFLSALILSIIPSYIIYYFTSQTFIAFAIGIYIFVFVLSFGLAWPKAKIIDISKNIDRDLSFMLKDMLIQLKSGILLYDSLVSASQADYGLASKKLREVVKKINQGYNERVAMQEIALTIKSDLMKQTLWRIISSLRIGGNVLYLLDAINKTLSEYKEREMKRYIEVVNISLVGFLLIGVVIPSIAIIAGVMVSSILGFTFSSIFLIGVFALALITQVFIIGYIITSKPAVMQ
jgi:pilus assembly protein TadC